MTHSDAEWRRLLTPEQYDVLRQEGTEAPGSSPLDHEFGKGTYDCAGCKLALFSSKTKFDSGTGWPSFYAPLPNAVVTRDDQSLMMDRTEVALPPLRRPPGSRLRRRSEADRGYAIA